MYSPGRIRVPGGRYYYCTEYYGGGSSSSKYIGTVESCTSLGSPWLTTCFDCPLLQICLFVDYYGHNLSFSTSMIRKAAQPTGGSLLSSAILTSDNLGLPRFQSERHVVILLSGCKIKLPPFLSLRPWIYDRHRHQPQTFAQTFRNRPWRAKHIILQRSTRFSVRHYFANSMAHADCTALTD
jgi:hypothetical protein